MSPRPARLTLIALCALISPPAWADTPLLVEVVEVRETPLTFDTTLAGAIAARDSVNIGFRQGGRITEVMVSEGDRVREGQALARTDPTQQQQGLRVAEAALASATATHEQTRLAHERAQAMLQHGVGTRAALDDAAQALSAAQGALAQARTALDQARRALDDTVMRAPTDALVTGRSAEPGQIVAAAQAVISLADAGGLEAVFDTPDMPALDRALGVPVSIQAMDGNVPAMQATIREISPMVDPQTGAITIRAYIDAPPEDLFLLGAAVRGTVHFPAGIGIEVPRTALTATGDQPAVWLVDDQDRVQLAPVTIERFTTESVVLLAGVSPGDRVVGAGSQLLYPGRTISPAPIRTASGADPSAAGLSDADPSPSGQAAGAE